MDQLDKSIAEQLREVTHTADRSRYPVMTGVVKSVNADEMTAIVKLTNDDESAPTEGVTLNVLLSNTGGMYALPADNADCLVMEVDGDGKWEIIRASEYSRVYMKGAGKFIDIKDSAVLLNGDGKGGLVQIAELKENLDTLKNYIKNTLEPAIGSGFTAVGAAMASSGAAGKLAFDALVQPSLITIKDMENKNVKHG